MHGWGKDAVTRGKPWSVDDERKLRQLVVEGKSVETICVVMDKTHDAVVQKMFDLRLTTLKEKKNFGAKKEIFSSSELVGPAELPNVEETLNITAAALLKSREAGLCKEEVRRLESVVRLARAYKEMYADYVNYRGIE